MPQSASPPQTRFEVFYARLSLELADARKSRQIGLYKRLNGNRKVRTVAETLSYTWSPSAANSLYPSEGVPSIFSRAIFSTPWYFRERPNFGVFGRFEEVCGLVRPHVRICLPRKFGGFTT